MCCCNLTIFLDFLPPDINECDDEEIRSQCQHGCENTEGSYRCLEPPTTTTTTTTTSTTIAPISQEEDYDEEEEDEDEPEEESKATTTSAPTIAVGTPCPDGLRRDMNGVCAGKCHLLLDILQKRPITSTKMTTDACFVPD